MRENKKGEKVRKQEMWLESHQKIIQLIPNVIMISSTLINEKNKYLYKIFKG